MNKKDLIKGIEQRLEKSNISSSNINLFLDLLSLETLSLIFTELDLLDWKGMIKNENIRRI